MWAELSGGRATALMTAVPRRHVRLDIDEHQAWALHAAIQEALAAELLGGDFAADARAVLSRLSAKVPSWLEKQLASAVGPAKPPGVSLTAVLARMRREQLIRVSVRGSDGQWS